jgi:hypothetical protein
VLTFAGHPIPDLADLPDTERRRLLRHLDAECVQAGLRHARILAARLTAARLVDEPDPPRVILARQLALVAETAPRRHDTRRTA